MQEYWSELPFPSPKHSMKSFILTHKLTILDPSLLHVNSGHHLQSFPFSPRNYYLLGRCASNEFSESVYLGTSLFCLHLWRVVLLDIEVLVDGFFSQHLENTTPFLATHSSILAWKISWIKESGGLQSMGSQRVRHNWATNTHFHWFKWQVSS